MTTVHPRQESIESLLDNGTIINESHIRRLRNYGCETIEDVALIKNPIKVGRAIGMSHREIIHIVHACQVRGQIVIRRRMFKMPPAPPIWFDIETDLNWERIWLIGMIDGVTGKPKQLFANTWNEEKQMLEEFHEYLRNRPTQPLLYYAYNGFDVRTVKKAARRLGLNQHAIFGHPHIDLYRPLKNAYWVPTKKKNGKEDRRLKTLAAFLGFDMSLQHQDGYMNGKECAEHYIIHATYGTPLNHDVFQYNMNDVKMLPFVVNRLEELAIDQK